MKSVLVFFALIGVNYVSCWGDYSGSDDCIIEGIDLDQYYDELTYNIEPIFDDHKGPILTIKRGSITGVKAIHDNNIAVSIKGDEIVFDLVRSLEDFDYNTETDDHNITLDQEVKFTCPEGTTYVYFYQTIADKNSYEPRFNRKVYTYKFGMDVAAGFELTKLLDIIVVDIDFTDYEIVFSTDGDEYLQIERKNIYGGSDRGKAHYARLTLRKEIKGTFDKTFKIYATDMNEPKKTGVAEVRLIRV